MTEPTPSPQRHKLTFMQTVASVLASFFGVQSRKNRERDFTDGNPLAFIAVGLGATALFVLTMWLVVKLVLHFAGA
ncbi:MAG: hypothetical protein JWR16_1064 [Nevskia sp.]|nr:hypothetical protein [Nevskia sp.]